MIGLSANDKENRIKDIGMYIHVPFCKAKCSYCDFNSYAGKDGYVKGYFDALVEEMMSFSDKIRGSRVKSIFIGGGTPSLVDSQYISRLMEICSKRFNLIKDPEISIETNPGTLSYNKLKEYRESGINRLSMGLQAWQEHLLKRLGRIHGIDEFKENFLSAREAGFENINVDLIFGLPGQTLKDWGETIKNVMELSPTHLSCYSLKVEEGTAFGTEYEKGTLDMVDEELDREMYQYTLDELDKYGLKHYEISNFAKPGFECKHNLIYWKAEEYLGLGAGAHSYLFGTRYSNSVKLDKYISSINEKGSAIEEEIVININEQMSEFMLLGLRLTDGVNYNEFEDRFKIYIDKVFGDKVEHLSERGLLSVSSERIKLTKEGLDLANQVFMEFI